MRLLKAVTAIGVTLFTLSVVATPPSVTTGPRPYHHYVAQPVQGRDWLIIGGAVAFLISIWAFRGLLDQLGRAKSPNR